MKTIEKSNEKFLFVYSGGQSRASRRTLNKRKRTIRAPSRVIRGKGEGGGCTVRTYSDVRLAYVPKPIQRWSSDICWLNLRLGSIERSCTVACQLHHCTAPSHYLTMYLKYDFSLHYVCLLWFQDAQRSLYFERINLVVWVLLCRCYFFIAIFKNPRFFCFLT